MLRRHQPSIAVCVLALLFFTTNSSNKGNGSNKGNVGFVQATAATDPPVVTAAAAAAMPKTPASRSSSSDPRRRVGRDSRRYKTTTDTRTNNDDADQEWEPSRFSVGLVPKDRGPSARRLWSNLTIRRIMKRKYSTSNINNTINKQNRIRQDDDPKESKQNHHGTILRRHHPTLQRVAGWFDSSTDELDFISDHQCRGSLCSDFNHDYVGMTNSCLHVSLPKQHDEYGGMIASANVNMNKDAKDELAANASLLGRDVDGSGSRSGSIPLGLFRGRELHDGTKSNAEIVIPAARTIRRKQRHQPSLPLSPSASTSTLSTSHNLSMQTPMEQKTNPRWWPDLVIQQLRQHGSDATQTETTKTTRATTTITANTGIQKEQSDVMGWRVLKYRRECVGRGQKCYETVRDAALEWEFHNSAGTRGMLPITKPQKPNTPSTKEQQSTKIAKPFPSNSSRSYHALSLPETAQQDFARTKRHRPIWFGGNRSGSRSSSESPAGGKPFVTYAGQPSLLWVVNPVRIVYELMDQRGPSSTYTSTAYATRRGHWLKGEERVSVVLRDGTQEVDVEIVSVSRPGTMVGKLVWPFIGPMQSSFFEDQLDALTEIAATESDN